MFVIRTTRLTHGLPDATRTYDCYRELENEGREIKVTDASGREIEVSDLWIIAQHDKGAVSSGCA